MGRIKRLQKGFTIIETVVVLAIIGLLTIVVVRGSGQNTRNERFNAQIREFTNILREAQTKSYSTQTGDPVRCLNASGTLITPCYWRGAVVELRAGQDTFDLQLLYGRDLSQFAQTAPDGTCTTSDQQLCIEGKQLSRSYSLNGIQLESISINGVSGNPAAASVAFLSPDGHGFVRESIVDNSDPANPFNPTSRLYSRQGVVTITFKDPGATQLTGTVTFDPAGGSIDSSIQ